MDKKKAIAAGHICLDITPAFKSKEEKSIKDLFRPGQLIAMDAAKVSLGGSVSNTGIGMKRLGADVELMGMVGNDAFGQMVLNELEKYDISPDSMIVRDGVGTSYSVTSLRQESTEYSFTVQELMIHLCSMILILKK